MVNQTEEQRKAAMLAVGLSPEQQTAVTGGTAITGADLGTTSAPNFQRSTDTPPPDISGIDTTQKTATKLAPAEQKVSDLTKRITDIQSSLLGKTSFTAEQEGVAGLPELEKTQTDLAAQIRGYQLESQALQNQKVLAEERIQQDITGRGVTRAASSVMTAEAQRKITLQQADIASRALTASAMFEAIKGNIVTANSQIDRAVKAKFGAKEEELAVTIANLQIALQDPQLTLAEKKRAEAQLKIKEAEKAQNDAKNIGVGVAPNLAKVPNGSLILDKIQKAKTKEEALQLAMPYLQKPEENTFTQRLDAQGNLVEFELNPRGQIVNQKVISQKGVEPTTALSADTVVSRLNSVGLNPAVIKTGNKLTKNNADKIAAQGVPPSVVELITQAILEGDTLEDIRQALATGHGKDIGFGYLDKYMSTLQEKKTGGGTKLDKLLESL